MPRKRRILYHAGFCAELLRELLVFNLCASALLIVDGDRDVLGSIVGSEFSFCSRCARGAFVAAFEAALEVDAIAVAVLWL